MTSRISSLGQAALRCAAGLLAVGACASTPVSDTSGRITSEAPGAIGTDLAMSTALGSTTGPEMFADHSIAAVGSASNQAEIRTSRLALERAEDPQVRAYAQRMIDEHTRLEQQLQALIASKGIAPVDNALSLQMRRNLPVELDSLDNHSGRDFDLAYIIGQIHAHDLTLKSLDTSLLPEVDDAAMRTMLQQHFRPAVASHLTEAKRIHHAMMGMGAGT